MLRTYLMLAVFVLVLFGMLAVFGTQLVIVFFIVKAWLGL